MFFQTSRYKIFLIGFIAFGLAACDQNNGTTEGQAEDTEAITLALKALSLEELKTKAENENPEAQYLLGIRYEYGDGVAQDYAEAMRWIRLSAEQGYGDAQYDLAVSYLRDGDNAGAIRWWRQAAEQGHAWSQFNLGGMYGFGEGVPQDDAEAAKWYRLSADQGHAGAQVNLGFKYRDGRGVPLDLVTSYMWFSLAAAQGDDLASRNKNRLKEKMTPEQIAEAEQLTQEWLAEHQ
ncbi:MAG: sel1 repeat family protein [Proteobacteria bacterium]|nr:sel1 repeat family protein [Pseudomonadota bacterium]